MLESEDIDGDLEEVNSASGDNTGDEEVAATGKSEEEKQKPKKKSIIVWQCLNPECTVTSKRVLRYLYLLLQSVSAHLLNFNFSVLQHVSLSPTLGWKARMEKKERSVSQIVLFRFLYCQHATYI